jgi:hypothetical protein
MGFPFYIFFMAISFIVGLFSLYQRKLSNGLLFFPWFLLLTLIVEIFGLVRSEKGLNNIAIYNFFTVFEFVFYFFLLQKNIQKMKARKIVLYSIYVYVFSAVMNIFFVQGMSRFHTLTYSVGCLMLVAVCIYYFFELFQLTKSVNLLREPFFWITSGLLFYYSCSLPIAGLNNLFSNFPRVIIINLGTIVSVLNVLLYSLFTIAFLCRFRIQKSM